MGGLACWIAVKIIIVVVVVVNIIGTALLVVRRKRRKRRMRRKRKMKRRMRMVAWDHDFIGVRSAFTSVAPPEAVMEGVVEVERKGVAIGLFEACKLVCNIEDAVLPALLCDVMRGGSGGGKGVVRGGVVGEASEGAVVVVVVLFVAVAERV